MQLEGKLVTNALWLDTQPSSQYSLAVIEVLGRGYFDLYLVVVKIGEVLFGPTWKKK